MELQDNIDKYIGPINIMIQGLEEGVRYSEKRIAELNYSELKTYNKIKKYHMDRITEIRKMREELEHRYKEYLNKKQELDNYIEYINIVYQNFTNQNCYY